MLRSKTVLLGLLFGWLLLLAACGGVEDRTYDPPSGSTTGTGGDLFPTGGGGTGGVPACEGVCNPGTPAFFDGLSMFWIGPPDEVPPCPEVAPLEGSVGYADFAAGEHTCPECSCAPSACTPPEQMHVSASTCPGEGAPSIPWNAPGWDGACLDGDAIAPGLICSGVPCTQSITIEAPRAACAAISEGAELAPEPSWGLVARECLIGPPSAAGCDTPGNVCVPAPPEGFTLCVHRDGDDPAFACPASYPRRIVVYAGVQDDRACEPCGCGEAQGASCSALVSLYTNDGCAGFIGAFPVTTAVDDACFDLPPGIGLTAKAAEVVTGTPGTCTQTGGKVGGIAPAGPVTLCCEDGPLPPAE